MSTETVDVPAREYDLERLTTDEVEHERPERPTLTCDDCGYTHEAGDGTWTEHDPNEPLWVYECPECGTILRVGGPVRVA